MGDARVMYCVRKALFELGQVPKAELTTGVGYEEHAYPSSAWWWTHTELAELKHRRDLIGLAIGAPLFRLGGLQAELLAAVGGHDNRMSPDFANTRARQQQTCGHYNILALRSQSRSLYVDS